MLADLRLFILQHVIAYVNILIINDNIVSCSYAAFRLHIYNCILHLAKKCCTSHNVWQYFKKWWFPIIQVRFAAFCCIIITKSTKQKLQLIEALPSTSVVALSYVSTILIRLLNYLSTTLLGC